MLGDDGRDGGGLRQAPSRSRSASISRFQQIGSAARRGPTIETLTRGGLHPGNGGPHLVGALGVPTFLPLICYEAIFARSICARRKVGRSGWCRSPTTLGSERLLRPVPAFRAEPRAERSSRGCRLARVANTGISAMIDPKGREVVRIELGEAAFADAELPGALPPTLYARIGERPALIAIILVFGLTFLKFSSGLSRSPRS
jgi:apolipoprotein N-acyltransferase